ncbi:MCAT [Symbiodinium sp. CCMP2592]|nr:MCAT [Symbiodinium sp. CCMP2592]
MTHLPAVAWPCCLARGGILRAWHPRQRRPHRETRRRASAPEGLSDRAIGCGRLRAGSGGRDARRPNKHWLSVSPWKEKTPAQVAAKLKHKEVFWAVIKHGSIVTDQDVLPREAQSIRNKTKRRVQVLSSGSLEAEGDEKNWAPSELRERLQQSGLNLGLYGHEGHKSLEDLVTELHTCQSELVTGPGKRIHRRVKLVRLQLLAIIDNSVRALVEVQSDAWLRAADQKLGKLPCRRIRQDETVEEAMKVRSEGLGLLVRSHTLIAWQVSTSLYHRLADM